MGIWAPGDLYGALGELTTNFFPGTELKRPAGILHSLLDTDVVVKGSCIRLSIIHDVEIYNIMHKFTASTLAEHSGENHICSMPTE